MKLVSDIGKCSYTFKKKIHCKNLSKKFVRKCICNTGRKNKIA